MCVNAEVILLHAKSNANGWDRMGMPEEHLWHDGHE
jgi:hypothetical protein